MAWWSFLSAWLHLALVVLSPFSTVPSLALDSCASPAQPGPCRGGRSSVSALARHSSHCKANPWIFSVLWQPWKCSTPSRALGCLQPAPQCLILNQYLQILEITQGEKYINVDKETKIMIFFLPHLFLLLLPSLLPQNKFFVSTPPHPHLYDLHLAELQTLELFHSFQ